LKSLGPFGNTDSSSYNVLSTTDGKKAMTQETIRILIVEDDEEDYMITNRLLSKVHGQKFDVVWTPTLAEGSKHVGDGFDAVLLDLSLGDSHGWETFTHMKQMAGDVPIILLTGATDENLGIRAVKEGAQDYLAKGEINSPLIGRAIRYAIERKQLEQDRERISTELHARNDQMLNELQMVNDMQHALLGRHFPIFPPSASEEENALRFSYLYRPTRIVGGDFFTVLPVSDTKAGVLICDVMGHGVRSALVTAIIRGLVEELKAAAADPARFLADMNSGLNNVLSDPHEFIFASALYCTVDTASGLIQWANAGHPNPLHIRPSTGSVRELHGKEEVGPAMGIVRDASYDTLSGELCPGDHLLLFTDGIFEMHCPDGLDYGEERLVETVRTNIGLPLDSLLTALLRDVETAAFNSEPDDDICLLGMELRRTIPGGPA